MLSPAYPVISSEKIVRYLRLFYLQAPIFRNRARALKKGIFVYTLLK
jgi:hypothetical protein